MLFWEKGGIEKYQWMGTWFREQRILHSVQSILTVLENKIVYKKSNRVGNERIGWKWSYALWDIFLVLCLFRAALHCTRRYFDLLCFGPCAVSPCFVDVVLFESVSTMQMCHGDNACLCGEINNDTKIAYETQGTKKQRHKVFICERGGYRHTVRSFGWAHK